MARRGRPSSAGSIRLEALEGRALMTVAPATPFASVPGEIASVGKSTSVIIPIAAGELQAHESASVVVGFAVVPAPSSTLSPAISRASGPTGQIKPLKIAPHGDTASDRSARQTHLFAQVAPTTTAGQNITVDVKGLAKTTGDYLVEAYLVGDVNGDGTVDSTDLASMQAAYGSREGQANYNAADDINGDGRVGCIDRMLLTRNLGTQVVIPSGTTTTPPATTTPPTGSTTTPPTGSTTAAAAITNPSVPLAAAPVPVNLVPQATATATAVAVTPVATTTAAALTPVTTVAATPVATTATAVPVAVATPVASTTTTTVATPVAVAATPVATTTGTVSASSVVPVAIASTAATPIYYTPVYANGTAGYVPVGTSGATTSGTIAAYPAGTTTTPVYLIPQPVATSATTGTAGPVYIYGQPVVGGATIGTATVQTSAGGTTAATPGSTLFGGGAIGTTTGGTTSATPVPVYLYGTPTYSTPPTPVAVTTG